MGDNVPSGNSPPGSVGYTNNFFTISGSGEDIEDTADAFYFVHQPLAGDGQIVARVLSVQGSDPQAEAGIMIRESLAAGSKHAFLRLNTTTNAAFRRRLTNDEYSVATGVTGTNRTWLRLTRLGNTFIAHCSTNGTNWDYVWFTTINMSSTVEVGLAVTAHHNGLLATGRVDNVSIGALSPLPGVWPLVGPKLLLGGEPSPRAEIQRIGGFKLLLAGVVGDAFTIKGSTNVAAPFASWPVVGTVTNTYGVVPLLDTQALVAPRLFYRAQKVGP